MTADEAERPEACTCLGDEAADFPCYFCWKAGFTTANPDPPSEDDTADLEE